MPVLQERNKMDRTGWESWVSLKSTRSAGCFFRRHGTVGEKKLRTIQGALPLLFLKNKKIGRIPREP